MGLSSALNTSLNGLRLNETKIDVIGNNIANADTTGFKASNAKFQTQLFRTLSVGSAPSNVNGGTNPRQIGLGASVSAISKDFSQGAVTNTTSPSDLAIQGDGFFVVKNGNADVFTRAGEFTLNASNQLVDPVGQRVQGYGVDEDFNIIRTGLDDLEIPLGSLLDSASQTTEVVLGGALLPFPKDGETFRPSIVELGAQVNAGATTGFGNNGGGNATGATLLTDLDSGGTTQFAVGETIIFSPSKGGRNLEDARFAVTATNTVDDFMDFLEQSLALPTGAAAINAGVITFTGQDGNGNALSIEGGDFQVESGGTVTNVTASTLTTQTATGESAALDFVVHDSLGQELLVRISAVLDEANTPNANGNTVFNWFAESDDTTAQNRLVGAGTLEYGNTGALVNATASSFTLERGSTAATAVMTVSVDFDQLAGVADATSNQSSNLVLESQNGRAPGTLNSFVIDESGAINGVLDNGQVAILGQIALATFPNKSGLIELGGNAYTSGTASGIPSFVTPGTFGAGTIISGAVELSNTDIGRGLVDLIVASTNYRGNARVINSVQELVDELLILGR